MKKTAMLLASFFGIGFLPLAPGSLASVAGLGLCFLLQGYPVLYFLSLAIITAAGFWVSGRVEKELQTKDPSCVVIDEVCGIMLAFLFLPMEPSVMWTGFFLFRAFDMFKIYPADRLEALGGSKGIMMDDIMAGVYTNVTMQIAVRLAGII